MRSGKEVGIGDVGSSTTSGNDQVVAAFNHLPRCGALASMPGHNGSPMLENHMTPSIEARNPAGTWQKQEAPEAQPVRPVSLLNILTEMLQGYRRPAVVLTEQGAVVCMNASAMRIIDRKPGEDNDGSPTDPKEWPVRAEIHADGQTLRLALPQQALTLPTNAPEPQLPPRLAKIARLVISGCTDKQIASRTGLSFSTVRTYVRQIYRRIGVHSRVELVHASTTTFPRD